MITPEIKFSQLNEIQYRNEQRKLMDGKAPIGETVIVSPNGTRFRLTVSDVGVLSAAPL